tara:strand:- start:11405 stop:11671 length:267 start_codon:yes stop_codon:yes gene_type:complete
MKKSNETKQLTEAELTSIQSMTNAFNLLKIKLGDYELMKQETLEKIAEVKTAYAKVELELQEVYGKDVEINIETGEVKEKEVKLEEVK